MRTRHMAMTLIEVVAGTALLGVLLVALLESRASATRQWSLAQQRLAAVEAAEELLIGWWMAAHASGGPSSKTWIPLAAEGETSGTKEAARMIWRTHVVEGGGLEEWGHQIVRLQLFGVSAGEMDGGAPLMMMDLVQPRLIEGDQGLESSPTQGRRETGGGR